MRSGVFAVSPKVLEDGSWEPLRRQLGELEGIGLFPARAFVSLVHPDLYPYPLSYYQNVKFLLRNQVRDELAQRLEDKIPHRRLHVLVSSTSERYELADQLSTFTQRSRASVLVLSHRGRSGILRRLRGSIAEAAVQTSRVPVLVLKETIPAPSAGPFLLFAVDPLHPPSDRALRWVVRTARLVGRGVCVLYVRPRTRLFSRFSREHVPERSAALALQRVVGLLRDSGVDAVSETIEEAGSVADTLEAYAEGHRLGLIVITSPRRHWLRGALLPSATVRLLEICARPLLVLRIP